MKRIAFLTIISLLLIACGKARSDDKSVNDPPITQYTPKEFEWHQTIDHYNGRKIDLYGFLWLDTIQGVIRKGNYTIYEKPNCYKCREVKMELIQDLVIIDLIDTNHIPDSVSAQWRLVKVTGMASNDRIITEKLERAVYSYPDYENSGYEKISNELIDAGVPEMKYVYMDGIIMPNGNGVSFIDGYSVFSITSTGLKRNISIYIKKGNKYNQAEEIEGPNGPMIINVKDQKGNSVAKKKIRLYGVWKNFINPAEAKAAGMVFVESIKILE